MMIQVIIVALMLVPGVFASQVVMDDEKVYKIPFVAVSTNAIVKAKPIMRSDTCKSFSFYTHCYDIMHFEVLKVLQSSEKLADTIEISFSPNGRVERFKIDSTFALFLSCDSTRCHEVEHKLVLEDSIQFERELIFDYSASEMAQGSMFAVHKDSLDQKDLLSLFEGDVVDAFSEMKKNYTNMQIWACGKNSVGFDVFCRKSKSPPYQPEFPVFIENSEAQVKFSAKYLEKFRLDMVERFGTCREPEWSPGPDNDVESCYLE